MFMDFAFHRVLHVLFLIRAKPTKSHIISVVTLTTKDPYQKRLHMDEDLRRAVLILRYIMVFRKLAVLVGIPTV